MEMEHTLSTLTMRSLKVTSEWKLQKRFQHERMSQEHMRRFHGMYMQKRSVEPIRTRWTHDGKKKRDSFYQHQEAGKQEKNQMGLLTIDDGIVNWGEHTEVEETNHALIAISQAMRKEDSIGKPLYSRFTKTNDFKGVPHPLSGDYTPKPQEEIDDSLYVYGKKGPQKPEISDSDDNSSEHSTCQSNDSEGSCGNTSEHSFESESESISVPNEMSTSRLVITNEKVMSELQEVEPSCAKHVKTPRQPIKDKETHKVNRKNWNDMMERELGEAHMSHSNAVMGNWGSAVKTSASYNWRNSGPNFNYNSGPTFIRTMNVKVDSTGQNMTGNKDQPEDFEEFNGGSVTFGELGHFNLFSISQICDKQHKVLFTETECLVVSSDFKMPDENQILLKSRTPLNVAQSQKHPSSTLPVPSTSSPPVQSPPPIPASIPASTPTPIPATIPTPTPIPETEPEPFEHTFEEPSPVYQHFSPPQEHIWTQRHKMTVNDLLQVDPLS
ncbi:hypothetical protein Tco_1482189 [Tanacetum coccineum]